MATRVQSNIKQAVFVSSWMIRFSTGATVAGNKGAVVIEYSGQLTASSLDPTYTATTGNGTSSASTSVTTGSITTTTANDTYVCIAAGDGATTTWTAPSSPWAFVQQNGSNT